MVRYILVAVVLLAMAAPTAFAQDEDTFPYGIGKHQLGLRLGGWINQGDEIPEFAVDTLTLSSLETSIKSGSFYLEAYGAYSIFSRTYLELSAGIVNRGSVTIVQGPFQDIGNLVVYPILLQLKYYPLGSLGAKIQPYIAVGGGFYHGRQSVQFTNDYYYSVLNEDSETDINYTLAAGADWLLNDFLALELHGRYMPINFSNALITARDYEAVSITVGIKYLYKAKK